MEQCHACLKDFVCKCTREKLMKKDLRSCYGIVDQYPLSFPISEKKVVHVCSQICLNALTQEKMVDFPSKVYVKNVLTQEKMVDSLSKVYVKKSSIINAGNGVFARKKIYKNEFVCFYDGRDIPSSDVQTDQEALKLCDYIAAHPAGIPKIRVGYTLVQTPNGVGQLINDCLMFTILPEDKNQQSLATLSSKRINSKIATYVAQSSDRASVSYERDRPAFHLYATRDIDEDEEIFLHYGIDYWISKIARETDHPMIRLYCLLKMNRLEARGKTFFLDKSKVSTDYVLKALRISPNGNIVKYCGLQSMPDTDKLLHLMEMVQ